MKQNPKESTNGDTPIIAGRNLKKFYQMGEVTVKALNGVDVEIYEGELIVILGPSGSGKSTLLNIIGGMDKPTEGELYYRGSPIHTADPKKLTQYRRSAVGFVFQFFNLIPSLTAYENILLSAQIAQNPLPIEDILKKIGLLERANHFPSQLSGGEQQRIAIARALVKNPDMLLCDEPTGALDIETGIQVLKLLKEFSEEYEKTVVIITHNIAIGKMAKRIFYLRDGEITRISHNERPIPPEKVKW